MKVLVAGGAGYIGSVVTRLLAADGHQVTVLDDCSTGHADSVPEGVCFVQDDIRNAGKVLAGAGFDAVLHFAAKSLVGESVEKPSDYWHANVIASRLLLDAITEHGVPRLVFSSTAAVYGEPPQVPITEDTPCRPTNPYGATKLAVDLMITGECGATSLAAVSLRYFNVAGAALGAGERHVVETHLIPLALQAVAGQRDKLTIYGDDWPTPDGTPIRDYVHVLDLARAHVLALAAAEPGRHLICNLGNGNGFSVREVVAAVEEVTGLPMPVTIGPRRPGDPQILVASAERAAAELGWRPEFDLRTMVADAWEFYRPAGSANDLSGPEPAGHPAADLFRAAFGNDPTGVWSAPGRVNVIGEHTDYNSGLVLPFAIDARTQVAAALDDSGELTVVSASRPAEMVHRALHELSPGLPMATWASYVAGTVWSLGLRGIKVPGIRIAISSTVPTGAGLSSSAALECAVGAAVAGLAGQDLSRDELARAAQQAENDFVGVPCGLMDQMASTSARAGHVLYFDVESAAVQHIPFDPSAADLAVLVIDTRAHHALADGEYARRRADCELAAEQLGLPSLRPLNAPGADLDQALARLTDDRLRRRVRHVVRENARVDQVVALLNDGRIGEIGPLLTDSHVSLRDDFEVSAPELDVAVDAALAAGALGARMTGGGFGGSAIALVRRPDTGKVADAVRDAFRRNNFAEPISREVEPAEGVRRDDQP